MCADLGAFFCHKETGVIGQQLAIFYIGTMKYSVIVFFLVFFLMICSYCPGQGNPVVQPSFGIRVASTPIPVKVGGKLNLIYELHLTNFSGSELHVTALEVLNSDSIRITIFDENAIIRRLHQPGKKP
jgi:hypothetical protein